MRKAVGGVLTVWTLALAGCEREDEVEIPGTVESEADAPGVVVPYVIEPLDGRVTVDTQKFEVALPPDVPVADAASTGEAVENR
jgi:hypothetical protein